MNKSEMELETGQEGYDVGYKEGFSDGQKAVSNINQLIKEAHDNAVKRDVYCCQECEGISGYPRNKHNINRGLSVLETCKTCKGAGKAPKLAVYWKIQEENEEFLKSTPSTTFHKDSEQSEIADQIITLLAYCGEMGYDIEHDIIKKIAFNKERK